MIQDVLFFGHIRERELIVDENLSNTVEMIILFLCAFPSLQFQG